MKCCCTCITIIVLHLKYIFIVFMSLFHHVKQMSSLNKNMHKKMLNNLNVSLNVTEMKQITGTDNICRKTNTNQ